MDRFYLLILFVIVLVSKQVYGAPFKSFEITDPQALERVFSSISHSQSSLYDRIANHFSTHYQEIAERKIKAIENGNDISVWGGLNHIGISYTHDFFDFYVDYRRDLSPDLFNQDRWIVSDTMSIVIDASTILGKLADTEIIKISEQSLAAYAGLKFKREYKYVHFANSYEEGLGHNLDRLFFSFLNFKSENFLQLAPYEILTKEDSFGFSLGALGYGTIPSTNFGIEAGILGEYQKTSKVQLQAVGPEDQKVGDEYLRISFEKSKAKGIEAHLGLAVDFYNLLKVTLLSYDLEYELKSSYEVNLSLSQNDLDSFDESSSLKSEIYKIFSNKKPDMTILAPHIVSSLQRKQEELNSKYSFLIFGKNIRQKTQYVQVVKDGVEKSFFKHFFEVKKFVQDSGSKAVSILIESLFEVQSLVADVWGESKNFNLEYRGERDYLRHREKIDVSGKEEKLKFFMEHNLYAYSFDGSMGKRFKKKFIDTLGMYSGVDPLVYNGIESGLIKGPAKAKIRYDIHRDGLDHFVRIMPNQMYKIISELCRASRRKNFFVRCLHPLQRSYEKYFKKINYDKYTYKLYDACEKLYKKRYPDRKNYKFQHLYISACIELNTEIPPAVRYSNIPMWELKDFIQTVQQKSVTKQDLYRLFAIKNITIHGTVEGRLQNNTSFFSHFKEGVHRPKSLIEKFLE